MLLRAALSVIAYNRNDFVFIFCIRSSVTNQEELYQTLCYSKFTEISLTDTMSLLN